MKPTDPEKPVFAARDLSAAGACTKQVPDTGYVGPDRRFNNRRDGMDRRADVRFEVERGDRRNNHGRRKTDPAPRPW